MFSVVVRSKMIGKVSRSFHQGRMVGYKKAAFDYRSPQSSQALMDLEDQYAAHTYHPIPVVFDTAKGAEVWDPEGKRYLDFLSAYSAVNQGHCHPKIVQTLTDQSHKLTLSSRAFFNSVFPKYAKFITELFGYHKVLPMNSGAEAVETALKTARRWGYTKKGIPDEQALIVSCENNFHGRTIGIISTSTDDTSKANFGPYLPGYRIIPYNDLSALEKVMKEEGKRIAGFLVEPIQGEAGIVIPDEGYIKKAYEICKAHNVLFMADEIQTGLCRTGKMLCTNWDDIKPDILILGKALSGGLLPSSCILADEHIMSVLTVGSHGSTYGGNPLASAIGISALEVLIEEDLAGNSLRQGEKLLGALQECKKKYSFVQAVRGRGLMAAIEMDPKYTKSAWDLCMQFKERGLLAKPTHDNIIRLAPPLVINDQQLQESISIINNSLQSIAK
eukprot:TRINITY_DN831_c0_g1_i1.p1 TRINITY_DN831_c0_g1~~TRINITY_DN831_c0_g1_i1.p1  ORF type:complete len:445 (+),score=112.80 TRINITY_DN831_c0_g1_i1:102-1436(+)